MEKPLTVNSVVFGGDGCSQQKLGSTQAAASFSIVLPSACSHLVVSIHLHSLIITEQVFPFYTSSPFSLSSFGKEGAFTTQLVWPPKTWGCLQSFSGTLYNQTLGFHRIEEMRKRGSVCVIDEQKWELCRSTPLQRETRFIITNKKKINQQQMSAHRFSPSAANYRHSRKDLRLRAWLLSCTHIPYTRSYEFTACTFGCTTHICVDTQTDDLPGWFISCFFQDSPRNEDAHKEH